MLFFFRFYLLACSLSQYFLMTFQVRVQLITVDFPPPQGGGYLIPPLGNQGRSDCIPHFAVYMLDLFLEFELTCKLGKNFKH